MKQHFVTFYSPGTFVAEQSTQPIKSWDPILAKSMADNVKERYAATPYGFQFTTRERGPDDLDSDISDRSPMYYINCEVQTLEEIESRNNPKDKTLIRNMKGNGWDRVVVTTRGWKWTQPLEPDDIVLTEGEGDERYKEEVV